MDHILRNSEIALIAWTISGPVAYWSPRATELLGWTEAEAMTQPNPGFLVVDGQLEDYEAAFSERKSMSGRMDRVVPVRHKDGREVLCHFQVIPLAEPGHTPIGVLQVLRKIDADSDLACQDSPNEFQFHHVFESSSMAMIILNEDLEFWLVNPACSALLGYSPDELQGMKLLDVSVEAERPELQQYLTKTVSEKQQASLEGHHLQTKSGQFVCATLDASRVGAARGSRGHRGYTIVQISDQTQQEEIKRDLATNNAQLQSALSHAQILMNAFESSERIKQSILSAIPSILIGLDLMGCVIQWNEAATQTFGIEEKDALDQHVGDLSIVWDRQALQASVDQCQATRKVTRADEISFRRSDGTPGILGITVNPVLNENGTPLGVLVLAADRTERLMLERQLMQAQKLESIGQLAAGIAHEINTPTQYVADNTRYVRDVFTKLQPLLESVKSLVENPRINLEVIEMLGTQWTTLKVDSVRKNIGEALEESLEGLDRVATIVRAMKEFSHPGGIDKNPTDLNHCVASTVDVTRNEWKYVAELTIEPDPAMPHVPCLAGEFNQVIVNMIINAAHAIEDKAGGTGEMGLIRIRLSHDDTYAVITISDSGAGIPESIRDRVFDPFFTTKQVGKGTGQGLTLAHDVIVKRHQGQISVDSSLGEGTTFTIRLPLGEQFAAA